MAQTAPGSSVRVSLSATFRPAHGTSSFQRRLDGRILYEAFPIPGRSVGLPFPIAFEDPLFALEDGAVYTLPRGNRRAFQASSGTTTFDDVFLVTEYAKADLSAVYWPQPPSPSDARTRLDPVFE